MNILEPIKEEFTKLKLQTFLSIAPPTSIGPAPSGRRMGRAWRGGRPPLPVSSPYGPTTEVSLTHHRQTSPAAPVSANGARRLRHLRRWSLHGWTPSLPSP